ncbi:MAG: hypothetical protein QOE70_1302 [Chthoniobacter sp.]|jgi:hypothetical protein|nr:hypothetical protein [Chthoniobacter sp.]
MDNFRSTFPLDEPAIARQALRQIMTDPITWVPLVPAVAAYTIFDVPAMLALGGGALVLGGVGGYWRKQWSGITGALRRKAVLDHNRAQDAILKAAADELRLAKEGSCAHQLDRFIAVKRKVEARLHEDGQLTAQKMQLEQLVDSLCFGVRDQLQALVMKEGNGEKVDRKATLQQVEAAFETLQSTVAELDIILGPTDAPGGASNATIEELTRRLREEAEIARRVQARLRAQESADASTTELPKLESE